MGKSRKLIFTSLPILFVVFISAAIFAYKFSRKPNDIKYIQIKGQVFRVEIADTQEKRIKGLSGRDSLPENQGMLFIFDKEGKYSFWMKDMLFPLDIIWINGDKEVVSMAENAPPCGVSLCLPITLDKNAKYVLELNAGSVKKINLSAGDKIDF